MKPTTQTVYGLTDEHGLIRYVGLTRNLHNRFLSHVSSRKLPFQVSGMAILATSTDLWEANDHEQQWIEFFGADSLCNRLIGGRLGDRQTTISGLDVRRWRQARGLTLKKLAALLGLAATTIYRWESGRSRPHAFIREALQNIERMKP
ncbi:MAG: GIY-YIG nuclease family protein [Nitrospira sp.]|nr:GIY-YIG nuclease family protein [Nitrospira sp.]